MDRGHREGHKNSLSSSPPPLLKETSQERGHLSETDRAHLRAKLRSLTRSKSCIEDLSKWILARPECHVQTVHLWLDELRSVNTNQLVPFLYLANAVMLSSSRSTDSNESAVGFSNKPFRKGFMKVMRSALTVVAKDVTDSARAKVIKLLGLWISKKLTNEEELERISKAYMDTWDRFKAGEGYVHECEQEDEDIRLQETMEEDSRDCSSKEDGEIGNHSSVSPGSEQYPDGSPYEPVDSYEDDSSKRDELSKFFKCESCIQLNDLDSESLLTMIRSEPDMRRLFLQKVPTHSLLEVHLKPLQGDHASCPKEQDLFALIESLCQLPSEDYDSRDTHNKFPDEFCKPSSANTLCQDSWTTKEFSSSIKNALAILCIFLKRLDVEMGVRSDATWKLQAFAKYQKDKLDNSEEVLREERLLQAELEIKLESLKEYVDTFKETPQDSSKQQFLTLPPLISGMAELPSAEDLFVQTKRTS